MPSNRFHRPLSSCALVEVHVELIDQLFNSIDPSRWQLKELLRRGRISLLIGLTFLSLSIGLGEISNHWLSSTSMAQVLHQSVLIGGWVAMWRPMEIFLYDWWPLAAQIRLLKRLAVMQVHIVDPSPADGIAQ